MAKDFAAVNRMELEAGLATVGNGKDELVSKFVKAWENQTARRALKGGTGISMALTLAACGGGSDDTTTAGASTGVVTPPAADPMSIRLTSAVDEGADFTGGDGADTFNAMLALNNSTGAANVQTLTILDNIDGGLGDDVLNAQFTGAVAALPTATVAGIETVNFYVDNSFAADITEWTGVNTVNIVQTGAAAAQSLTAAGVSSVSVTGGSTVAVIDVSATAALAGSDLATVTVDGATGAVTLTGKGIATVNAVDLVTAGQGVTVADLDTAHALTLNLNGVDVANDGAATANTITFTDAEATSVVVNAITAASYDVSLVAAKATSLTLNADEIIQIDDVNAVLADTFNIQGDSAVTISAVTALAADAVITSTSTGAVTIVPAIAAGQQYVGGSGVDTVSFAATGTTASSLGGGDDVATFAGAAGVGGSVDGGAGTDTVSLTGALAVSLSAATAFEADISSFEVLAVGQLADTGAAAGAGARAIQLANLDDINSVTLAGAVAESIGANTTTISGFASGGTFEQTALLGTNSNVALTGAFTGAADTFNINASAANGFANAGSLTLASVENVVISLEDTDTTANTVVFDFNLDVANATSITVSGAAGITFANGTHANVTTMDASGVTLTGAGGAVTFTATTGTDASITGGAGNDALTGGAANDTITGNAGNDALGGAGGDDVISGGAGDDVINGGTGADQLTGGAGEDLFVFATAAGGLHSGDSAATADTITDFTAADDTIRLLDADTVATAGAGGVNAGTDVIVSAGGKVTFAAADDTLAEKLIAVAADNTDVANDEVVFFEDSGNTYIYGAGDDTTNAAHDFVIVLEGVVGYETLTAAGTDFTFV